MTPELRVEVVGLPAPQGSKRHVGRGILVESSKNVAPWRDSVAYATREAMRAASWVTLDEPCAVAIDFYLPRPASAPKSRTEPDRKPDIDKLIRSTLDALTTAGAIADDARIVNIGAGKHYAGPLHPGVGAEIYVLALGPSRKDTPA
jgi:Holliday junction resolvase RusA-like endonuclease